MASYSVATTKDQLSRLIDRAQAGEEVVITRHGKPAATINAVRQTDARDKTGNKAWLERLRSLRETIPPIELSSADLVRQLRDESAG